MTKPNRSILDIVRRYLSAGGFDGLYSADGECACDTDDLAPCGETPQDCRAGYKVPCPSTCGAHDWHIQDEKLKEKRK